MGCRRLARRLDPLADDLGERIRTAGGGAAFTLALAAGQYVDRDVADVRGDRDRHLDDDLVVVEQVEVVQRVDFDIGKDVLQDDVADRHRDQAGGRVDLRGANLGDGGNGKRGGGKGRREG